MQLMDQKYLRGDGLTGNFWSQLRTGGCNLGSNSRADPAPGVESRSRKRITDSSFRSVRRYCVRSSSHFDYLQKRFLSVAMSLRQYR
jgi:hypothetical protein